MKKFILKIFNKKRCCICNKKAKYGHNSIFGQVHFPLCKTHLNETSPALGYDENIENNRMGLLDKNGKWVKLKYFKEIIVELKRNEY
jgi:hypothetical protein